MRVKNVVVGVDGSECAQRALEAAIDLTHPAGTVHVVSAYDEPSTYRINQVYQSVPEEYRANIDLLGEPRAVIEKATEFVGDSGVEAVEHFIDNDPASAILDTAANVGADLIVVGNRGLGRASQILRGSVSTKIAHSSPINFMVVH